nr:MAG TPA: hypothetical protein [Caudoviricetes sp.]DAV54033.1 MAG TPA: hypothetical protein [Caudoviricetes sp.]
MLILIVTVAVKQSPLNTVGTTWANSLSVMLYEVTVFISSTISSLVE